MQKRLLITGFDPFGGQALNPSWSAVEQLPDTIGDYILYKLPIPTVFGEASGKVLEMAAKIQPHMILCIGLAGGRKAVTPERIAVNIRDARIPDNAGIQPIDEPIVPGAPAAYFSTVPIKAMVAAIQSRGLPGEVSNSAGTFVCNDVLYTLLHHYAGTDVKAGFLHVPYLPQQGTPSLTLEQITAALEAAIEAC